MVILVAILAKDKSRELPLFLECLFNQTIDKKQLFLYIRTNDNNDNTIDVLKEWLDKNGELYNGVYYDDSDVNSEVKKFDAHEWNDTRFKTLALIRQQSIQYAMDNNMDYIVIDVDNYIKPNVIQNLYSVNLPVVGPLLKFHDKSKHFKRNEFPYKHDVSLDYYANYHSKAELNGYFKNDKFYNDYFNTTIKGLIEVDVIHCTYLIRNEYLKYCNYIHKNKHIHEYVVFSNNLRRMGIKQYLDTREVGGFLNMLDPEEPEILTFNDIILF